MWCVARFATICTIQFPWDSYYTPKPKDYLSIGLVRFCFILVQLWKTFDFFHSARCLWLMFTCVFHFLNSSSSLSDLSLPISDFFSVQKWENLWFFSFNKVYLINVHVFSILSILSCSLSDLSMLMFDSEAEGRIKNYDNFMH